MNTVLTMALKDLRLLTREPIALFWIFVFPLLFAFFFGSIMGGGGGRSSPLSIAVVDEDDSEGSRAFVDRLAKSESLKVDRMTLDEARNAVRKGNKVGFVLIKKGFGESSPFTGGQAPAVAVGMDPARTAEAGYLQGLLMEAASARFQEFFSNPKKSRAEAAKALKSLEDAKGMPPEQRQTLEQFFRSLDRFMDKMDPQMAEHGPSWQPVTIESVEVMPERVRPPSGFAVTFPSSVMWGMIGCVTGFSLSIVTERTGGTWLRLRTSPVSRGQILAGKGLACFLACAIVAAVLLLIGRLAVGVRMDSPFKVAVGVACGAFCFTGIMMFLSTLGKTEQAVSGFGMGIMMPMAMIGGGMIPLFVMPLWLQRVSVVSPMKWAIEAVEGPIWRGYGLDDLVLPWGVLVGVGAVFFALGVVSLARQET